MKLTIRDMKTYPTAQTQGFFDVELRVQWLEAKGNPLSRRFHTAHETPTDCSRRIAEHCHRHRQDQRRRGE